jgi:Na+/proline symporter
VIFGALVILVALKMSQLKELSLFQLTQRLSILIGIPIIVPLFLGLIVKRTPPWSAWSTVVVGFLSSLFITENLTPEWAAKFFGVAHPLDAASREYWRQSIELFGNVAVCSTWFVATKLFWSRTTAAEQAQVEEFFTRLRTPVDFAKEEGAHNANDNRQSSVVGWLCLAYGVFVSLLALIPNSALGRLAFLGCGGIVVIVGLALLVAARRPAQPAP